jgi:hypothetical protein
MEQVIDWLNENELRAYPLLDEHNNREFTVAGESWRFPDNFILDLQLKINSFDLGVSINSGTATQTVPIVFREIISASGVLSLVFGSETASAVTFSLEEIPTAFPHYIRTAQGNLLVLGEGLLGFLQLAEDNDITLSLNIPVEPSTVTQFNGPWLGVSSISCLPEKETVEGSYKPQLPLDAVGNSERAQLTGDIKFLEGYNFRLVINNNLIDLGISTDYGLIMRCDTSFLAPEYLDCDELVSYVNGVAPDLQGNLTITSGANINITNGNLITEEFADSFDETANNHTLFVGLSFKQADLCSPVIVKPE